jgi:hypothetical protein
MKEYDAIRDALERCDAAEIALNQKLDVDELRAQMLSLTFAVRAIAASLESQSPGPLRHTACDR